MKDAWLLDETNVVCLVGAVRAIGPSQGGRRLQAAVRLRRQGRRALYQPRRLIYATQAGLHRRRGRYQHLLLLKLLLLLLLLYYKMLLLLVLLLQGVQLLEMLM